MKRTVEFCGDYLIVLLGYHGLDWLLVRYAGSVLPPAFSPALWTVDGVDAFILVVFMALRDYIHKIVEKRLRHLEPTPPQAATPPKREGQE